MMTVDSARLCSYFSWSHNKTNLMLKRPFSILARAAKIALAGPDRYPRIVQVEKIIIRRPQKPVSTTLE